MKTWVWLALSPVSVSGGIKKASGTLLFPCLGEVPLQTWRRPSARTHKAERRQKVKPVITRWFQLAYTIWLWFDYHSTTIRPCYDHSTTFVRQCGLNKQAVGGRPPRYAPAPLLPRGRRSAMRHRADGNVAAVSHGQQLPTPTAAAAWRANTAVSKAAWWPWPLTFWPWKWCPSHVWRGYLCANFGLPRPLCSRLRPDSGLSREHRGRCTRQMSLDVRQRYRLMPPPGGGRGRNK